MLRSDDIPDPEVRKWFLNRNHHPWIQPLEFHRAWRIYKTAFIIRNYVPQWPDSRPLPLGVAHSYGPAGKSETDFNMNPLRHFWVYGDREYKFLIDHGYSGSKFLHRCGHPACYIKQTKQDRNGTIFVPDHQAHAVITNFDSYCEEVVKKTPKDLYPICMCMHQNMMNLVPVCERYQIPYICSGIHGELFYQNLLGLFGQYKYLSTTYCGSPLWFGVLAGCECFYLGTIHKIIKGRNFVHPKQHEEAFSLNSFKNSIEDQKRYLDLHFGVKYKKSPGELFGLFQELAKDYSYRMLESLKEGVDICGPKFQNKLNSVQG